MLDFIVRGLSHIMIPMFLIGMAGSAIVVAVTLVRDIHDFLSDNGEESARTDGLN